MKQQQLNDELTIIGLIFTILILVPLIYFNFNDRQNNKLYYKIITKEYINKLNFNIFSQANISCKH